MKPHILPPLFASRTIRRYRKNSRASAVHGGPIPAGPRGGPRGSSSGPQTLGLHSDLPGSSTWRCLARGSSGLARVRVAMRRIGAWGPPAVRPREPVARRGRGRRNGSRCANRKARGGPPATVRGPRQLSAPVIGLARNCSQQKQWMPRNI